MATRASSTGTPSVVTAALFLAARSSFSRGPTAVLGFSPVRTPLERAKCARTRESSRNLRWETVTADHGDITSCRYRNMEMLEEDEQQRLNLEFTNDLLLGGFDDTSDDTGATATIPAADPVKALIEDKLETMAREGVINVVPTDMMSETHDLLLGGFDDTAVAAAADDDYDTTVPAAFPAEASIQDKIETMAKEGATPLEEVTTFEPTIEPPVTAASTYEPPGLRTIIKFAIPAVGVWLCDPLLSLIDTAAVGLLAGTNHQAALSPAVAVVNYSALLLAFLFTATTNFVASATAASNSAAKSSAVSNGKKDAGTTLLSSLQISLYVGLGLGTALFALAPTLLRTLIGRSTPIDPAVFNPAVLYVRIRSLGFPAAAVLGSAQAACLGLKDIRSPLLVLGTAAVVNLLGDAFLVGSPFPLLYGAAGAAWATVLSQLTAVWIFLGLLKAKPQIEGSIVARVKRAFSKTGGSGADLDSDDDAPSYMPTKSSILIGQDPKPFGFVSKKIKKMSALFHHKRSESSEGAVCVDTDTTEKSEISARGLLSDRDYRKRHILHIPSREHWSSFLPYVVPVTTTSVGRVSLFLSMAHVVSSCMGVVGMAAQTIVLALFDALCPLAQSLSLTAQAFVPAALEHQKSVAAKSEDGGVSRITRQFLKAGSIFGALGVLAVGCVPLISRLFTTDAAVIAQVNAVAPHLAGVFAMHGIVMASEGVLLGRRDINFLGWMYGAFFALMPAIMMRVKHGALATGNGAGLHSIWTIFLGYQFARMVLWALRAMRPLKTPDVATIQ